MIPDTGLIALPTEALAKAGLIVWNRLNKIEEIDIGCRIISNTKFILMKKLTILLALVILITDVTLKAQNVFTVTKTTDPDPFEHPYNNDSVLCDPEMYGTLQWALRKVNDATGGCVINFNIPGSVPHTVLLNFYLPQIINTVTIDGLTQAGYQFHDPAIIIDGQGVHSDCFNGYNTNNIIIRGLYIRSFLDYGIVLTNSNNSFIYECVINGINNGTSVYPAAGIKTGGVQNCTIQGNLIGTDNSYSDLGNEDHGILFLSSTSNSIIGGTGLNEENIIAFNGSSGMYIGRISYYNRISGNRIYNNPMAITLIADANQGKAPPVITDYDAATNILSGTSQPDDIIEIFGSTGSENANEYLVSTTADISGNWSVQIPEHTWQYVVATATDTDNNTSQLSDTFIAGLPLTKLTDEDCGAIDVTLDQLLKADSVPGATQYEFLVENFEGFSESIIKQNRGFKLEQLEGRINYNNTYNIRVRIFMGSDTGNYGQECTISTIKAIKDLPECEENCNLVCYGDFENLESENIGELSDFIMPGDDNNSPDFFDYSPGQFNGFGCDENMEIPNPNPAGTGTKYIGVFGYEDGEGYEFGRHIEVICFPLSEPLVPDNTYDISFYARAKTSGCFSKLEIYLSETEPCSPPGDWESCGFFTPYPVTSVPIIEDSYWMQCIPQLYPGLQYTNNTGVNLNYLIITGGRVYETQGLWNGYAYLDDVRIEDIEAVTLTISGEPSDDQVCIGQNFSITYTVCYSAMSPPEEVVTFQYDIPTGIDIMPNAYFNGSGQAYILPSDWNTSTGCYELVLDLTVNDEAIPGTDISNIISVISGGCFEISNSYENLISVTDPVEANVYQSGGISCYGACDGEATVEIISGELPFTFQWNDGNNQTTQTAIWLCAGEYTVIVTDAHNCSATLQVTITEPEQLSITNMDITNSCTGADDGSVEIDVDGGTPPYSYNWSNGEITEDIYDLAEGTYNVTVTDNNGCTTTAFATIVDLDIQDPDNVDFYTDDCIVAGMPAGFHNNSTPPCSNYEWDFGDGSTSTDVNPQHEYERHGYYCVTLTASGPNVSLSYSEVIFVYPGQCACDENVNYDIPDGTVIEEFVSDIWYFPDDGVTVEGDVIVPSGIELNIVKTTARFGPKGRIIVEPGGKLRIRGSTLTNLDAPCDQYMWQGIEIRGNTILPPEEIYQGTIVFEHSGSYTDCEISNAHIGVLLGARYMDRVCIGPTYWVPPYYVYETPLFETPYRGGLIKTQGYDVFFVNNGIDIKMLKKKNPFDEAGHIIKNFHFLCTEPLHDPDYNIGASADPYDPYPNERNPWTGYANEDQRTDAAIWMEGQKTFNITDSEFDNKENCILSYDSKYNVYNSSFTQSWNAISIKNSLSAIDNNHEISGCTFDEIPGKPYAEGGNAITIKGGRYDYIHDNTIGGEFTQQEFNYVGIYTSETSSFNISENIFNRFRHPLRISDSKDAGGYIGAWTSPVKPPEFWWAGNIFNGCYINIFTYHDNSKLKLKCNICHNNDPDLYKINFETWNKLADQGLPPSWLPGYAIPWYAIRYPAGNEFKPEDIPVRRRIESNDQFEGNYTYYRHDAPLYVEPYVNNSPATINVHPMGMDKTTNAESCPPPLIPVPGPILPAPLSSDEFTRLDSMAQVRDSLKAEYDNVTANLDQGETEMLLTALNSNMPRIIMTGMLITHTPLSDTVLITAITRKPAFSPVMFTLIMLYNLPISDKVEPYFYERLKTMPYVLKNLLMRLQASNPYSRSPGSYEQKIEVITMQRQLYLNNLVMLLNDTLNNRKEDAIILLENEGTIHAEQALIATYLADSNYSAAAAKLAAMPDDDPEVADWVQLNQLLLSLFTDGKNLHQMDSAQVQFVRDLAYKCPAGPGTANAQAILHLLYREEFDECPPGKGGRSLQVPEFDIFTEYDDENEVLGENYPDPAGDHTTIPYYLPEGISGRIEVRDINGRMITQYEAYSGEHKINIDTGNWNTGVYIYSLIIEGLPLISKKMVINK